MSETKKQCQYCLVRGAYRKPDWVCPDPEGHAKKNPAKKPEVQEHHEDDDCEHCVICKLCLDKDEPQIGIDCWLKPNDWPAGASILFVCGQDKCVLQLIKEERHTL